MTGDEACVEEVIVAGELVVPGPDGHVQLPLDHCTWSVQTQTEADFKVVCYASWHERKRERKKPDPLKFRDS